MNTAVLFTVTALVNALWQPALIAAIAWAALKISRCTNATTRHAVWTLALVAGTIVPLLSAVPVALPAKTTPPVPVTNAYAGAKTQQLSPKTTIAPRLSQSPFVPSSPISKVSIARPSLRIQPTLAMIVTGAWLLVALAIVVRLLVSFLYLERLKHDALPLAVEARHALTRYDRANKGDRDVRVCVSGEITVPVAVGIFDAMILLPSDLVDELDQNDLDRILLHELAHLRRSDDWVNLFERIVQAVFFFSPGIYWISRQMDLEREVACDDWVLEQSSENVPYARCLARIVEMTQWPYTAPAAPGVFVTRKSMSIRIERLLARGRDVRIRLALVPSLLSLLFIAAVVVAGGFVSPTIAYTLDQHLVVRSTSHRHLVRPTTMPHFNTVATAPALAAAPVLAYSPTPAITKRIAYETTRHREAFVQSAHNAVHVAVSSAENAADSNPDAVAVASDDSNDSSQDDAGSYLDELAAAGYRHLTVDEVIELRSVGVDANYIRDLQGAGLKNLSARDLVQLKSMGVDGDFVRSLANAGYPNLDTREYIEWKSMGVDGGYLADLRSAGLQHLDAHQVIELKSMGINSSYVQDIANAGYPHLPTRQYVQMKSLGIDGDYIRKLRGHGFDHLSAEDIIRYKSIGL